MFLATDRATPQRPPGGDNPSSWFAMDGSLPSGGRGRNWPTSGMTRRWLWRVGREVSRCAKRGDEVAVCRIEGYRSIRLGAYRGTLALRRPREAHVRVTD